MSEEKFRKIHYAIVLSIMVLFLISITSINFMASNTLAQVTPSPNVGKVIYTLYLPNDTLFQGNVAIKHSFSVLRIFNDSINNYLYVLALIKYNNSRLIEIYVINPLTNKVVTTIKVGYDPYNRDHYNFPYPFIPFVYCDPSNHNLYATTENSIVVINPSTNQVIANITVGNDPSYIVSDSLGNYLYVLYEYSNEISVINTSTNKVIANILVGVGKSPYYIFCDPINHYLYVPIAPAPLPIARPPPFYYSFVIVINPLTNQVIANISVGNSPSYIFCDPLNHYLYVTYLRSNVISVINPLTNQVIANISVGNSPSYIFCDPLNHYLYVTGFGSSEVSVINSSTNQVITNISLGGSTSFPIYCDPYNHYYLYFPIYCDPLNHYLYVTAHSTSWFIDVINPSTNQVIANISVGNSPDDILCDPINHYLYVTDFSSNEVSVINPSTNKVIANISVAYNPEKIFYDPINHYLYVVDSNSSSISIISTSSATSSTTTIPTTTSTTTTSSNIIPYLLIVVIIAVIVGVALIFIRRK
ncbi:hypothetical protein DFR86_11735 [Acidianus sulfidivorans JP7]|uniref:YncE family protein n=1 Tax=Acidianus sulfidivorans JP7 TaxID=619593 RepID=A0A2U9IQ34_9CREN|nr:YncE family protein [Acidianus sulfidivorans]AWR98140.1 hypothetical protein DFR86_11735 [Acidianus sulfidivorans JP7]